jgi:hypothetical protein
MVTYLLTVSSTLNLTCIVFCEKTELDCSRLDFSESNVSKNRGVELFKSRIERKLNCSELNVSGWKGRKLNCSEWNPRIELVGVEWSPYPFSYCPLVRLQ